MKIYKTIHIVSLGTKCFKLYLYQSAYTLEATTTYLPTLGKRKKKRNIIKNAKQVMIKVTAHFRSKDNVKFHLNENV